MQPKVGTRARPYFNNQNCTHFLNNRNHAQNFYNQNSAQNFYNQNRAQKIYNQNRAQNFYNQNRAQNFYNQNRAQNILQKSIKKRVSRSMSRSLKIFTTRYIFRVETSDFHQSTQLTLLRRLVQLRGLSSKNISSCEIL